MPTDGMDGNVIIKIEVGPDLSLQTTMVNVAAAQQQQNKLTPQNQDDAGKSVKAAEYLEKMSVRGLDIQRYEHIVDGVTYCLVCAKNNVYKTFKNKYSFQRHAYLLHEGENRKIFPCPVCNREFSRPDKMKMHKKDKHGSDGDIENNAGTPPPPAKRSRTGATKTPRSRSKASTNNNSSSTLIDDEEATKKRLAQIDSIFEDVLNANSNHSQESTEQQQAEQIDSAQSENQQLGLFNNVVLPAAAQLQLTLANQSPTTAATLTTLEGLQPTLLNNIKQEQDHMNNSNELALQQSQQQAQQLQYATLGNVQFIDTMQNYQILTSNNNNNIAQNYHSSKQNTNNLQFSMSPYSFNQVQTQNGTHLVLTTASANPQVIVNGFQGNPAVIKIESSSN